MAEEILRLIPASLHQLIKNYQYDWQQSCEKNGIDMAQGINVSLLGKVWACSDFSAQICIRHPDVLHALFAEGVSSNRNLSDYEKLVDTIFSDVLALNADAKNKDEVIMRLLRQLRQKEMLRIAWRDLADLAEPAQILFELSDLSEAMVARSLCYIEDNLANIFGQPVNEKGESISLVVLAMGKMGGRELNFSSDIDLILSYAEEGETLGPRKTSHHEFFLNVARKLIKYLHEVTADGFVYRVDTRLRPHGDSGPLVLSFSGMEQYYQLQGRNWERYAMIKARMITGSAEHRQGLQAILRPFIYRRYLDYSAFESIREMKTMIAAQMKRKGMRDNVKLGPGGIREIEFIGQTFQLLRGGRELNLRRRSIIAVLAVLVENNLLSETESEQLIEAYWFLRRLENRIQMQRDQQTHLLPTDEQWRSRLCVAMELSDWSVLLQTLDAHQQKVEVVFDALIAPNKSSAGEAVLASQPGVAALSNFWSDQNEVEELEQWLVAIAYVDCAELVTELQRFLRHGQIKRLGAESASRLILLLSSLIEQSVSYEHTPLLVTRILEVLQTIAGRAVYISMLNEYPQLQQLLLKLFDASEWFASNIAKHPLLLDSLINTSELFTIETEHESLLIQQLSQVESPNTAVYQDDVLEQQMDRLRLFKQQNVFKVAILDVFYQLPVESVGDQLSATAAAILKQALKMSWLAMVKRYGAPECTVDGEVLQPQLSIIGYGKLGGDELGYGSDLDIIFLHDSLGKDQNTNGEKSIDNQRFFARVAQRLVHILSTQTYSGDLYEVDTRLRPNGQSGMMVSSIAAFEHYQRENAWLWEHQALIRARFITGNAHVEQEFGRIRDSVLSAQRQPHNVCAEVVNMREKMRKHLVVGNDTFNIKQSAGGLVDIEFLVQAGVLIHAEREASLLQSTSTLELIQTLLSVDWFSMKEAEELAVAYRYFRRAKNWQSLSCEADLSDVAKHRDDVINVWSRLMPDLQS